MVIIELQLRSCLVLRFEMGWMRIQVRGIFGLVVWGFGGAVGSAN